MKSARLCYNRGRVRGLSRGTQVRGAVVQIGRTPPLHGGGQGFESPRLHLGVVSHGGFMPAWNLSEHGDIEERTWWPKIGSNFPNYEVFWREHIVPLTCRAICPSNIRLRPSVLRHFSQLATAHYATFLHVARSHVFLPTFTPTTDPPLMYEFYSHLSSIQDTISKFHHATNAILDRYDVAYIPDLTIRLKRFGDSDLGREYDDTFKTIDNYRNHLIHDCGTIMFDGISAKGRQA